ncbi:alpha/beta fold hydrolase [Halorhodospira halophila]|uniref:alpha/beta fold hydrolase n=1 Tax=Halorhodospira TaxID=85108 RepID=UPI001EE912DA|nr:alpha/beta fold hydrolase [Halorhodospira halophila]MCG5542859.1 alpha/beta fold hydrolase [Halorhodospira sp. 9628]
MTAPLLLVPGWSFDARVFAPLRAALEVPADVLELPGHGGCADPGTVELAGVAAPVIDAAPDDAVWVGWSLGGTVALEALRRGKPLRGVVLIAATPRFTMEADWPCATPAAELTAMQAGLGRSPAATDRRFRRQLGRVSADDAAAVADPSQASNDGLAAGLAALAEADLRGALAGAVQPPPTLWLGGGRDPLVPTAALQRGAAACGGRVEILDDAGHLPHCTHATEVAQAIHCFLEEVRS